MKLNPLPVLKAQITQGLTPHELALSCAIGAMLGIFPLFGMTTLLGVAIGVSLRLNQPTLQAVNYLMAIPQLVMIPLFVTAGERVLGSDPVSLDPRYFGRLLFRAPADFFYHYGWALIGAVLAWLVFAPIAGLAIYAAVKFILQTKIIAKRR